MFRLKTGSVRQVLWCSVGNELTFLHMGWKGD